MLTLQQKAQLGVGLAQEAIIQFLNTRGNSALQADIQETLGLGLSAGAAGAGLVGTLLAGLASQNIIRIDGQGNQANIQLLTAQTGAFRGAATTGR